MKEYCRLLFVCEIFYLCVATVTLAILSEPIDEITKLSPDICFVALGIPIQEELIINNIEKVKLTENKRFKSQELRFLEENLYESLYKKYDEVPKNMKLFFTFFVII